MIRKKILFFRRKWPFLAAKWNEKLDFVLKNQEIWKAVFFQAIKWLLFSQTSSKGSGKIFKNLFISPKRKKTYTGNGHKIIYYIQTWPSDVKKFKMDCRTRFWNYVLTNLTNWKTEHLIAQLRTGFRQKVFRLKVYFKPSTL